LTFDLECVCSSSNIRVFGTILPPFFKQRVKVKVVNATFNNIYSYVVIVSSFIKISCYLHTMFRKELIWSLKHLLGGRIPYDVLTVCCISFHSELFPLTLYLFFLLLYLAMWFFQILQRKPKDKVFSDLRQVGSFLRVLRFQLRLN
jgi:hypothetical protein